MIAGLKPNLHRAAFAAVRDYLMNHPILANRRVVRTWITWDGKGPVADPPVPAMPAVELRLLAGPVERLANSRRPGGPMTTANRSRPRILVDVWTGATDQGDAADVGDALCDALFPRDPDERGLLDRKFLAAGIADWRLASEILPTSAEDFDQQAIHAQGLIELTLQFDA